MLCIKIEFNKGGIWVDRNEYYKINGMSNKREVVCISEPNERNVQRWYLKGTRILHREDGPAVIYPGSSYHYYYEGRSHNIDGPAIYFADCSEHWFYHGVLHRMNGPAIRDLRPEWSYEEWYLYGDIYPKGGLIGTIIALLPLELPPYVVLWILEWTYIAISKMNRLKLVALLEGIRNSRWKIKGIKIDY